jgi:hypothetical protein
MTDKTEEQIAKDKAAVDAMRNAKSNMDAALARISTLEEALSGAIGGLLEAKRYISPSAYVYGGAKTAHHHIEGYVCDATKALG